MIMRELGDMEGFRTAGTVANNLRYADDTVIVAESEEQLQVLLNGVFQIDNYSYMPYRRPREYSGTGTVVHLFRKFVFLICKM